MLVHRAEAYQASRMPNELVRQPLRVIIAGAKSINLAAIRLSAFVLRASGLISTLACPMRGQDGSNRLTLNHRPDPQCALHLTLRCVVHHDALHHSLYG